MILENQIEPALKETKPELADKPTNFISSPELWVDRHGDYLFDYALMRLRSFAAAQDAVQETLLAALRGQLRFCGTVEERGWLVGILKNKIHDYFRKRARQPNFSHLNLQHDEDTDEFCVDGLHQGSWHAQRAPANWPARPGDSLDNSAFWKIFYDCTSKLPSQSARAFLLRELDNLDTREICSLLEISESNLWVLLHRARLSLRRCLEKNWFTKLK